MRDLLRQVVPSMFHRRLLMLAAGVFSCVAVLGVQTLRLTTGDTHSQGLTSLRNLLVSSHYLPTIRGRVLDRQGLVLAQDAPGYQVAVRYPVISGAWSVNEAKSTARSAYGAGWTDLNPTLQSELIAPHLEIYQQQARQFWSELSKITGASLDDIDRERRNVQGRVERTMSSHWRRRIREIEALHGDAVPYQEVTEAVAEMRWHHVVVEDVSTPQMQRIRSLISRSHADEELSIWRYVEIRRPRRRLYPQSTQRVTLDRSTLPGPLRSNEPQVVTVRGVGLHLIGTLRPALLDELHETPFVRFDEQGAAVVNLHGRREGDVVGATGIEAAADDLLRGWRGRDTRHAETQAVEAVDPRPGHDVRLTIDIDLQARVQAVMSPDFGLMRTQHWHNTDAARQGAIGEPLNGAAVVLDIATGEVLAAVSMPELDPLILRTRPELIYGDKINRPDLNRVIGMAYPPGSTIKPMTYTAGVSAGAIGPDETYRCIGFYDLDNDGEYDPGEPRDWYFKDYGGARGELGPVAAIRWSNNPFFAHVADTMGRDELGRWFRRYGFGRVTNVGIDGERVGNVPEPASLLDSTFAPRQTAATRSDTVQMGFGQGSLTVTPMQLTNAYATLARGGRWMTPTLVHDADRMTSREMVPLALNPRSVRNAIEGLREVVNVAGGTGRLFRYDDVREEIFNVDGVDIVGKSGTAQAPALTMPTRFDERGLPIEYSEPLKTGNHSWFVTLVRPEGTTAWTHVIVVVVEYGGSGSQIAGPVNNQIIHQLQTLGYLPTLDDEVTSR